jgi:hypothetical protein
MHACMPETGKVRQLFMGTSLSAAMLPLNLIAACSVDTLAVAAFSVTHVRNDVYDGQTLYHCICNTCLSGLKAPLSPSQPTVYRAACSARDGTQPYVPLYVALSLHPWQNSP